MKNAGLSLLAAAASAIFMGCGGRADSQELSREYARKLIEESDYGKIQTERLSYPYSFRVGNSGWTLASSRGKDTICGSGGKHMEILLSLNWIEGKPVETRSPLGGAGWACVITLTDEGRKHAVPTRAEEYKVPPAEFRFLEVTGITTAGGESMRLVKWDYEWIPNEFGKRLDPGGNRWGRKEAKSVFFKYDDGWRLER
ncbi:MAG: hypothetical protein ACRD7E_04010 [Bryobacteraceae bacterium]